MVYSIDLTTVAHTGGSGLFLSAQTARTSMSHQLQCWMTIVCSSSRGLMRCAQHTILMRNYSNMCSHLFPAAICLCVSLPVTANVVDRVFVQTQAVFYSTNEGLSWEFSHCAPFAPLKPSRLVVLSDGTVVCWMTANGKLSASFSCDRGEHWHVDPSTGKPHQLDPEFYGYPGGTLLHDESICIVYYDAV